LEDLMMNSMMMLATLTAGRVAAPQPLPPPPACVSCHAPHAPHVRYDSPAPLYPATKHPRFNEGTVDPLSPPLPLSATDVLVAGAAVLTVLAVVVAFRRRLFELAVLLLALTTGCAELEPVKRSAVWQGPGELQVALTFPGLHVQEAAALLQKDAERTPSGSAARPSRPR
jgi:hypothetical protein